MRSHLVAMLLLFASAAQSEPDERRKSAPEIPDFRISITNLFVLRYNPLGLEDQLRIGAQQKLYASQSRVLQDNFIFFGLATRLNPAFVKAGPSLEIQPLSVLNLRFSGELMGWFGTFHYLQSFNSPRAEYSDTVIDNLNTNYVTDGAHFIFEPTIQMKLGPVALRNRFSLEYWSMRTRAGDTVFYEPTLDTLIPANGWILSNDLDVLYLTKFRFVAGLRYSVVQPLYRAEDYLPGEPHQHDNGHQRLGPLLAYTFFDRPYTRFNKPSLILIVNWYVDHRYRTGADVNAGIPYLVLAFAFTSDLGIRSTPN